MSEYNIPTDGNIRSAYDAMCQLASAVGDFLSTLTRCSDRWLAEHDREVAAKTLIDAAQDIYIPSDGPSTYVDIDYAELLASLYLKGRAEQIKKGAGE